MIPHVFWCIKWRWNQTICCFLSPILFTSLPPLPPDWASQRQAHDHEVQSLAPWVIRKWPCLDGGEIQRFQIQSLRGKSNIIKLYMWKPKVGKEIWFPNAMRVEVAIDLISPTPCSSLDENSSSWLYPGELGWQRFLLTESFIEKGRFKGEFWKVSSLKATTAGIEWLWWNLNIP